MGPNAATHGEFFEAVIWRTENLSHGFALPVREGIYEEWSKASPGKFLRFGSGKIGEFDEGGVEIDKLHDAGARLAVSFGARVVDDERSAGSFFEKSAFLPDALMFAKVVSMVAPKDDEGVFSEAVIIKGFEHAPDLGIDERDTGIVGPQSFEAGEFVEIVVWDGIIVGESGGWNVVPITGGSIGEAHFFQGIKIEVFLRRDERGVGTKKSRGDEEGFVLVFLHEVNGFRCNHSVGLLFVGSVCFEPAQCAGNFPMGLGIKNKSFVSFVAAFWIDCFLPRGGIVKAICSNAGRDVIVVDFSHPRGRVAMVEEVLGEGGHLGDLIAEVAVEVVNLDLVGP